MKDILVVLHQKEVQLARVRLEIAALRLVTPLLEEPKDLEEPKPPSRFRKLFVSRRKSHTLSLRA